MKTEEQNVEMYSAAPKCYQPTAIWMLTPIRQNPTYSRYVNVRKNVHRPCMMT